MKDLCWKVDFSISDLVADLRAPTPSAAAELVVQNRLELERHLDQLILRLAAQMRSRLSLLQSQLHGLEKRLKAPTELLQLQWLRLQQLQLRLRQAMNGIIDQQNHQLTLLFGRLETLSPLAVLSRGYAIVKRMKTGEVIQDSAQLEAGDRLQLELAVGHVTATVTAISGKEKK